MHHHSRHDRASALSRSKTKRFVLCKQSNLLKCKVANDRPTGVALLFIYIKYVQTGVCCIVHCGVHLKTILTGRCILTTKAGITDFENGLIEEIKVTAQAVCHRTVQHYSSNTRRNTQTCSGISTRQSIQYREAAMTMPFHKLHINC